MASYCYHIQFDSLSWFFCGYPQDWKLGGMENCNNAEQLPRIIAENEI